MSRQASPTLIGAFVFGAFALGIITVLLLSGGQWFREYRQQVLYFTEGSQGLRVGAPVVFLGVKVGTVKQVQIGMEKDSLKFLVPVTIEIEPSVVQTRHGDQIDLSEPETLKQLIKRGLRAQLRMQSLLTGQLYVSLDFYPDKPAHFFAMDPQASEIPTIPTTVEELSLVLEQFPMDRFLNEIAAISASLSKILASDEIAALPQQFNRTLQHFESLAQQLKDQGVPVLNDLRTTLVVLDKALNAVTLAADRLSLLTDPANPLLRNLNHATQELANAAQGLRNLSREDAPLTVHFDQMLQEIARAARALRELAETLEQQPESLLRGKRPPEQALDQ
ncbi:MAG: MCE family protein [Deltaproteobacteria bacterium]|jgi:paraquat-inducible protein B|nr:MCE family protein [Deltaproteobacteria bacterium]